MFGTVKSFEELFEIGLRYAYDCEQKLVEKGLPTMIENTYSKELQYALTEHLQQTRHHVQRLEQVFAMINNEPVTKTNAIFDKMADAVKDSISNMDRSPLRDAALIFNGNLVEHYEVALYGSLAAFARNLGLREVAAILEQTLEEEKRADAILTQLGETLLNPLAVKHQVAGS
jgi:ferritin-like metal-binding protein YciE